VAQHEFVPSKDTSMVSIEWQWCQNNISPDAGSIKATNNKITAMFLSIFMDNTLFCAKVKNEMRWAQTLIEI
jgi:hypothetical protein